MGIQILLSSFENSPYYYLNSFHIHSLPFLHLSSVFHLPLPSPPSVLSVSLQ